MLPARPTKIPLLKQKNPLKARDNSRLPSLSQNNKIKQRKKKHKKLDRVREEMATAQTAGRRQRRIKAGWNEPKRDALASRPTVDQLKECWSLVLSPGITDYINQSDWHRLLSLQFWQLSQKQCKLKWARILVYEERVKCRQLNYMVRCVCLDKRGTTQPDQGIPP